MSLESLWFCISFRRWAKDKQAFSAQALVKLTFPVYIADDVLWYLHVKNLISFYDTWIDVCYPSINLAAVTLACVCSVLGLGRLTAIPVIGPCLSNMIIRSLFYHFG